jgi:hypothetical protein
LVTAYKDNEYTDQAAQGAYTANSGEIVVSSGSGLPISVALDPAITGGSTTGSFAYSITLSNDYTGGTNQMIISPFADPGNAITNGTVALIGGTANAATIDNIVSGIYYVDINLSNTANATYKWRQVLHVYDNLTSTMPAQSFTAANLGVRLWNVTFNFNDDSQGGNLDNATPLVRRVQNNTAVTAPTTGLPSYPAPNTSYEILSWHENDDYSDTAGYNFSTNVTSSFPLYAKWGVASVTYAVSLTLNIVDGGLAITGMPTSAFTLYVRDSNGVNSTSSQTITVGNAGDYTAFSWVADGEVVSTTATATFTHLNFNSLGSKVITLTVTPTSGSPVSRDIPVNIVFNDPSPNP